MDDKPIVIDTPEGIAFYQLASLKGALALELKGMTRRGPSAYSIAKERYGLKGNRQSVFDQLQKMVDDAIAAKETERDNSQH